MSRTVGTPKRSSVNCAGFRRAASCAFADQLLHLALPVFARMRSTTG
jgi:hypothetical protein